MKIVPRQTSPELPVLDRFRREFDRMLDNFWSGGLEDFWPTGQWMPRLDVAETADALVVTLDVPGADPKKIDISVTGNVLTVRGQREEEKETKEKSFHRVERAYGAFSRVVTLPSEVDVNKITATAKDGVLTITLPKHEEAKPRQIKIDVK